MENRNDLVRMIFFEEGKTPRSMEIPVRKIRRIVLAVAILAVYSIVLTVGLLIERHKSIHLQWERDILTSKSKILDIQQAEAGRKPGQPEQPQVPVQTGTPAGQVQNGPVSDTGKDMEKSQTVENIKLDSKGNTTGQ